MVGKSIKKSFLTIVLLTLVAIVPISLATGLNSRRTNNLKGSNELISNSLANPTYGELLVIGNKTTSTSTVVELTSFVNDEDEQNKITNLRLSDTSTTPSYSSSVFNVSDGLNQVIEFSISELNPGTTYNYQLESSLDNGLNWTSVPNKTVQFETTTSENIGFLVLDSISKDSAIIELIDFVNGSGDDEVDKMKLKGSKSSSSDNDEIIFSTEVITPQSNKSNYFEIDNLEEDVEYKVFLEVSKDNGSTFTSRGNTLTFQTSIENIPKVSKVDITSSKTEATIIFEIDNFSELDNQYLDYRIIDRDSDVAITNWERIEFASLKEEDNQIVASNLLANRNYSIEFVIQNQSESKLSQFKTDRIVDNDVQLISKRADINHLSTTGNNVKYSANFELLKGIVVDVKNEISNVEYFVDPSNVMSATNFSYDEESKRVYFEFEIDSNQDVNDVKFRSVVSGSNSRNVLTSSVYQSISLNQEEPGKKKLSAGAIAGIVIGSVGGVAIIGLGIYYLNKRRKAKKGKVRVV